MSCTHTWYGSSQIGNYNKNEIVVGACQNRVVLYRNPSITGQNDNAAKGSKDLTVVLIVSLGVS